MEAPPPPMHRCLCGTELGDPHRSQVEANPGRVCQPSPTCPGPGGVSVSSRIGSCKL